MIVMEKRILPFRKNLFKMLRLLLHSESFRCWIANMGIAMNDTVVIYFKKKQ